MIFKTTLSVAEILVYELIRCLAFYFILPYFKSPYISAFIAKMNERTALLIIHDAVKQPKLYSAGRDRNCFY